jgi:hypothetical protein
MPPMTTTWTDQDHQDFEVETGFSPGRRGALRDEWAWSIHIDNLLSVNFEVCFVSFLRRGFPSKNHGAKC